MSDFDLVKNLDPDHAAHLCQMRKCICGETKPLCEGGLRKWESTHGWCLTKEAEKQEANARKQIDPLGVKNAG